jgi:hypothetical protein
MLFERVCLEREGSTILSDRQCRRSTDLVLSSIDQCELVAASDESLVDILEIRIREVISPHARFGHKEDPVIDWVVQLNRVAVVIDEVATREYVRSSAGVSH